MDTPARHPNKQPLRFVDNLSRGFALIAGTALNALVVTTSYGAISRYFFKAPTSWGLEMSECLLAVTVLLGGAYTILVEGHVRVELLYRRLSTRTNTLLELGWLSVTLLFFCVALIWQGSEIVTESFRHNLRTAIMQTPLFFWRAFVPLGGLLLALQIIAMIVRRVSLLRASDSERQKLDSPKQ